MPQQRRTNNLERVAALVFDEPWAALPRVMDTVSAVVSLYLAGEKPLPEEALAAAASVSYGQEKAELPPGPVAVVPLHGAIMAGMGGMSALSGGVDPAQWAARVTALADSPDVREIVLDVDSGGGTVKGTQEMYRAVQYAASRKPVTAVSNGDMCSAAYWACSPATAIVATDTATVGSISVIATHRDTSEQQAGQGVKTTVLRTGPDKALGTNPHEPLTEASTAHLMEQMRAVHDVFVRDVAQARGVTSAQAQERWASGRVWIGEHAVAAGIADRMGTLRGEIDAAMQRAATGPPPPVARRAAQARTSPVRAALIPGGHPMDPETLALLGLSTDATPEAVRAAIEKRALNSAATTRANMLAALGLDADHGTDAHLKDLAARAQDGLTYREAQLDRLHALTITSEGNDEAGQQAADDARAVYAGQPIERINAHITRLEARRDTLPDGQRSKTGDRKPDVKPLPASAYGLKGRR